MGKVIGEAKLSSKNQVVIPKTVRVLLDIKPGDKIEFVLEDHNIYIRKKTPS